MIGLSIGGLTTDLAPGTGVGSVPPGLFAAQGNVADFTLSSGSLIAVIGDSIENGPTTNGFLENVGWKLYIPSGFSKAVSGTEVDDSPDNNDYADYQLPLVLALNPKPAACLVGGAENSSAHGKTDTNMINGFSRIFTALRAAGIKMLVRKKIATWGESPSYKAARAAAVNAWLDSVEGNDLILLDKALQYDLTGNGQPGDAHPDYRGGYIYGGYMAAPLSGKISGSNILPSSGNLGSSQNLFTGWAMGGTAGTITAGATGNVATNWTLNNTSGATCVASKGTVTSGDVAQVITLSGTATGGSVAFSVSQSGINAAIGEGWEWLIEYELAAADGTSDAQGVYWISVNDNNVVNASKLGAQNTLSSNSNSAHNLTARKAIMRAPVILSAGIANPYVEIRAYIDARATDAVLKIGRVALRRIPEEPVNNIISFDAILATLEGTGTGTTVTLTARRGHTVGSASVNYAVTGSSGSPAAASDFSGAVFPSGTITIADGSLTGTATFTFAGDSTLEADEGYTITPSNPSAGYTVGPAITSTITDDDSGVTYESESLAYFARWTTPPTTTAKGRLNTLVLALKTGAISGSNIWAKLDILRVFNVADTQAAKLNMVSSSYPLTNQGTGPGAFTADVGYTGSGNSSNYLLSSYTPGAGLQNANAFGVYSLTSAATPTTAYIPGGGNSFITPRVSGDTVNGRDMISISQNQGSGVTDGSGLFAYNRSSSSGYLTYRNGAQIASTSRSSTAPDGATVEKVLNGTSTGQVMAAFVANVSLTANEHLDLYNALHAFGVAQGTPGA